MDLCSIPARTSPDGSPPNFIDPPSLEPTVIAIATIFTSTAVVIATGRFFVNRKSLAWADYMMFLAIIFDLAAVGLTLSMAKYYRHGWDLPVCWFDAKLVKELYAQQIIVMPALFFPKASIFSFYLQIFSVNSKIRIGSKIGLIFAFITYFVPNLVTSYFEAPHEGETWLTLETNGMPAKGLPGGIVMGCLSVLVDIYIFVLPMPTLIKLNMAFSRRVQLVALFGTAFMGVVASVVCMVYRIKLLGLSDSMWQWATVYIPILVEINVAIIVGSLPAFASFFRIYVSESRFLMSLRSRFSHTRGTKNEVSSVINSDMEPPKARPWTYGSSLPPSTRAMYHELMEPTGIKSQASTVSGDRINTHLELSGNDIGIYRSVEISQVEHTHNHYSSDRLV